MSAVKNRPGALCRDLACRLSKYHGGRCSKVAPLDRRRLKKKRPAPRVTEGAEMLAMRRRASVEVLLDLRRALEGSKFAGAPKLGARIRLAITSAQGAVRHLDGLCGRAQRAEERGANGRG